MLIYEAHINTGEGVFFFVFFLHKHKNEQFWLNPVSNDCDSCDI